MGFLGMQVPPTVKAVGQYVKRAEEAENDGSNPDGVVIAFWCRQWAIEKSIPYFSETEVADFVSRLMDIQEAAKEKAGDKDKGREICESNANTAFDKADEEDKSGSITKTTAKLFYYAATYLDILEQFDELKENKEIEQKRVYAKWKAHDILTALKEGRQPTPGSGVDGPSVESAKAEEEPESPPAAPVSAKAATFQSTIATPSAPPSAPSLGSSVVNQITSIVSSIPAIPTSAPSMAQPLRGPPKVVDDPRIQDAIELSNFAITSMKYMRLDEAKERLREAIARLERS